MSHFVAVAKTDEIPEGQGRAFPVEEQLIAIFQVNGQFLAIDDICPHQGASLAEGHVCEGEVACPWHAWRFRLDDGTWADNPRLRVNSYEVRVEGDQILVNTEPRDVAKPE